MAKTIFTDREEDEIERIALGLVETKSYMEKFNPGHYLPVLVPEINPALSHAVASPRGRFAINIFGIIPRNVQSDEPYAILPQTIPSVPYTIPGYTIDAAEIAARSSKQFVGTEIIAKGVNFKCFVQCNNTRNWRLRFSVISTDYAVDTEPDSPTALSNTDYNWMEDDTTFFYPTTQSFNPRTVNVLKMWNHEITTDGAVARMYSHWCPITGKKKVRDMESNGDIMVGTLANRNYYLVIEWFTPIMAGNYTPTASDYLSLTGEMTTYFKDP